MHNTYSIRTNKHHLPTNYSICFYCSHRYKHHYADKCTTYFATTQMPLENILRHSNAQSTENVTHTISDDFALYSVCEEHQATIERIYVLVRKKLTQKSKKMSQKSEELSRVSGSKSRKRTHYAAEFKRAKVCEYFQSGMGIAAFSQKAGIPLTTLIHWVEACRRLIPQ